MRHRFLVLLLVRTLPAFSQTAKVIALSSDDAKTAKSLHEQQEELTKKQEQFNQMVRERYLMAPRRVSKGPPNYFNYSEYKDGWSSGQFELSDDFLFIVPKPTSTFTCPSSYGSNGFLIGGGCGSFTTNLTTGAQ